MANGSTTAQRGEAARCSNSGGLVSQLWAIFTKSQRRIAMRQLKRAALIGMMLGAWLITAPGTAKGVGPAAHAPHDPVKFSKPTFVDPPKTLLGDAGDRALSRPQPAVPEECRRSLVRADTHPAQR